MPTYALLVAALVAGGYGYVLFRSSTAAPEVDFTGDITVYVSDSRASAEVTVRFFEYLSEVSDEESAPGFENAGAVDIDVAIEPPAGPAAGQVAFVLVTTGDARLSSVRPSPEGTPATFHVAEATDAVEYRSDAFGSETAPAAERQVIVGRFGAGGAAPLRASIAGRLVRPASDTEAGITFVQMPTLTSGGDAVTFGDRYGVPGSWHGPATAAFDEYLGSLPLGTVVESADPEPRKDYGRVLAWLSTEEQLNAPRATVVDRSAQQRAGSRVFVAGAMAGIAGGLLVELMARSVSAPTPPRRRRPRSFLVRPDSVRPRRR